jgi:hypothetical protein
MFVEFWGDKTRDLIARQLVGPSDLGSVLSDPKDPWHDILKESVKPLANDSVHVGSYPAAIGVAEVMFTKGGDVNWLVSAWSRYGYNGETFKFPWDEGDGMQRVHDLVVRKIDDEEARHNRQDWEQKWLIEVLKAANEAYECFVTEVNHFREERATAWLQKVEEDRAVRSAREEQEKFKRAYDDGEIEIDWARVGRQNGLHFGLLDVGETCSFFQTTDGVLLVGENTPKQYGDFLTAEGAAVGTLYVESLERGVRRGRIQVTGAVDQQAFKDAIRAFSRIEIKFVGSEPGTADPLDPSRITELNTVTLKAAQPGEEIEFWQAGDLVLLGRRHPDSVINELVNRGAFTGTVVVTRRGSGLDPGEIVVWGSHDEKGFKKAIRKISNKQVTFGDAEAFDAEAADAQPADQPYAQMSPDGTAEPFVDDSDDDAEVVLVNAGLLQAQLAELAFVPATLTAPATVFEATAVAYDPAADANPLVADEHSRPPDTLTEAWSSAEWAHRLYSWTDDQGCRAWADALIAIWDFKDHPSGEKADAILTTVRDGGLGNVRLTGDELDDLTASPWMPDGTLDAEMFDGVAARCWKELEMSYELFKLWHS